MVAGGGQLWVTEGKRPGRPGRGGSQHSPELAQKRRQGRHGRQWLSGKLRPPILKEAQKLLLQAGLALEISSLPNELAAAAFPIGIANPRAASS